MNKIFNFKTLFLFFYIFLFLIALFYLYEKHLVQNDSTISEWLINFQGGFIRRGLIGEISFNIAKFFNLNLRFVIFIFQSFIFFIFIILIYNYIKSIPKNLLTIAAIYSPIFLLYQISEIEILVRKEIFIYIGFLCFLYLASIKINKNYSFIYIFIVFPILCLIWEPFVIFIPFIIFILLIRNNAESFKDLSIKILLSLSSTVIITAYILMNPLSAEGHTTMANSLMQNFGETCYMSCSMLSNISINSQFMDIFDMILLEHVFRYFIIMLLGFLPLIILCYYSEFKHDILLFSKFKNLLTSFIIITTPSLILFASMTDWGRVVNMIYTFSIFTYLFLIKNNLITTNFKILILDDFYSKNKKIFIFIFFIFAFGWNQKTSMNGDVSTNSLYKILYNTSKKVFKFDGIRIFQDSPIIKFHKKYIE